MKASETVTQSRNEAHELALAIVEANKDKVTVYDNTHSGPIGRATIKKVLVDGEWVTEK